MVSSVAPSPSLSVQASPLFSAQSSTSVSPLWTRPPLETKFLPIIAYDRQIDNVIFDLGDVLFAWSANTGTSISSEILHSIRSSNWFEYEKGNIGEGEAYAFTTAGFSLDAAEVGAAFRAARDSLQSDHSIVTLLHELKAKNNDIQLFAMSNISAPDWEILRRKGRPEDWALFERVFTSAAARARERKPDLGYFHRVLESIGVDPRRTAFVDDKSENVVTARSLWLKGIVFTSFDEVARELRTLVRNPIIDGERYLREHAGELNNFFKTGGVLTTTSFPYDLDTTSIACTVSDRLSLEVKNDIMNEILTLKNKDGIIQTYFDVTRPRIDPIVCVNMLTFFYSNGRGGELRETFDWVYEVLKNRAYTNGTLYYYGPDIFIYFLSRLFSVSLYARQRIGQLFAKRVAEQFGSKRDALAMRIHAAMVVDLRDSRDYERLTKMQEADGSWLIGWIYEYGVRDILIGNKGLTTALATSALRNY